MTNPWIALDAATRTKNLYLRHPSVITALNSAFESYQQSVQTIIKDRLDDTTGYFGTQANELAVCLEGAFNSRGATLTTYCEQQLSQASSCVETANSAATALTNFDTA
jgi:hypothetical protein